MNILDRITIARAARADAARAIDAKDRRMVAALGRSPTELDGTSFAHRQAVLDASSTGTLEEIRDDLRAAEDFQARLGDPLPYTAGLAVAWAVEFAGALLVLKAMGVSASNRLLPALALTATTMGLTRLASKSIESTTSDQISADSDEGAATATTARRQTDMPWRRFVVPAALFVLVGAIAMIRVVAASGEDLSLATAIPGAILMIAVTVGPAFAAVFLERKRAPALELARRIDILRQRADIEARRIARAEKHLHAHDRRVSEWNQENARRRALYMTEFELARGGSNANTNTNTDPTQSGADPESE